MRSTKKMNKTVRVSTTLVTDGVEGNNAANAFQGMYDCGVGIVL